MVYVYPAPIVVQTLFIESLKPVNQFSTLQTAMALPGEYQEAIVYLLAHRLAPQYGATIGPELEALITDAKERIMRKNIRPKAAQFEIPIKNSRFFNIYTG